MVLLRSLLGDALRRHRQQQRQTLREISGRARISLGYLSEVERGRKEASSELLEAICGALAVPLSTVLAEVADGMADVERHDLPALAPVPSPGTAALTRPAPGADGQVVAAA